MISKGEIGRFSAAVIKRMIETLAKIRPAPPTSIISAPQILIPGNSSSEPVADHGALDGLADDDHSQYALLAGRAGGQVLIGGTSGGNYLDLKGVAGDTLKTRIGANAFGLVDASNNTIVAVTGVTATETVFNEAGSDIDYRFEGDTDQYLLKLDGGTDRVGLGVAAPDEKLDVNGNLALAEQSVIASGTAGKAKLIATDQNYLAYRDSDGRARNLSFAMQKRVMQCLANIGRTDVTDIGSYGGVTLTSAAAGNGDDSTSAFVQITADRIAVTRAGLVSAEALVKRAWLPEFVALIRTGSDITNVRFWIGLFSGVPNADDPSLHLAAFRFSTGVPDTNWQACTKDGTTLQANDTGVTVAADTAYVLRLEYDGTNFYFWVNDAALTIESSNLPGTTTGLYVGVYIENLEAAGPPPTPMKDVWFSRWAVMHK
ncbi:MAG: hypothetical protein HRF49_07670 [bacterium]